MPTKGYIPAKPARSVDELIRLFGTEEGLVDAFLAGRIEDADFHVISPTWLSNYLLRRVLVKLDDVHAAVRRPRTRKKKARRR